MTLTTTLNALAVCRPKPCRTGREVLLRGLGKTKPDADPLSIATILTTNGLSEAIWALRTIPDLDAPIRKLSILFAHRTLYLTSDHRLRNALVAARQFADGTLTDMALKWARQDAIHAKDSMQQGSPEACAAEAVVNAAEDYTDKFACDFLTVTAEAALDASEDSFQEILWQKDEFLRFCTTGVVK